MSTQRFSVRAILRRFLGESRAAAMVEFAIVVALLIVLVFGMIDWAGYFLLRANVTNAVRDGARYGAVLSELPADTVLMRQYTRARLTTNPDSGIITVTFPGTVNVDRRVKVTLSNYPYKPLSFVVIKALKRMTVAAEFRREQP